jgi:vancomycin resistance protein YoaR
MAKTPPARTRPRPAAGPDRRRRPASRRRATRARQIAVLGLVALVGLIVVRGLMYRGDVAPGVSVAGVEIGGLSPDTAKKRLEAELGPRLSSPINVTVDKRKAEMVPAELDARVDYTRTIDDAMQTGRLRSILLPFAYSAEVEPTITIPPRPRIPANLRLVSTPARSAKVRIENGKVAVSPARHGHAISARAILLAATNAAIAGERRVRIESRVTKPAISTEEARAAGDRALEIASAPVALNVDGKRIGALSTAALENAVTVRNEDGEPAIAFSPKVLAPAIAEQLGDLLRDPVNAMWDTNGERAWVIPARKGHAFDPRTAADAVRAAALGGGARQAEIELNAVDPGRSTEEAESYEITQRVSGAVTELGDSSENRIHNVALMASILDNRLVMPGETFSFNEAVGPRTPERGFLEGRSIVAGLLLPSIGGGVCQVATTLFDAAFDLGLQVNERTNHSFYIYHYRNGLDAAVSWDGPDLKFTNNTEHPVLIRAAADASTMIVNLYSAPSERTVETITSERYAIKKPKERYLADPYAPPGKIIEYTEGQEGFSVDVTRIVRQDGEVISEETFPSKYVPEAKTFLVGPGAFPPGDNVTEEPPFGWESPYSPVDVAPLS